MFFWWILLGLIAVCIALLLCSMVLCGAFFFYRCLRYWSKLSDKDFYDENMT